MPRFAPATAATLLLALVLVLTGPAAAQGSRARTTPAGSPAGSGLAWNGLSAEQRTALRPLRELWPTLGAEDQRQWLAMARNFNRLSPAEQSRLQQRMNDWARLSPTQRSRARLNFGEVRRVPRDERRERWEQYQELSPEERARLARDRPKPPAGAAPALRPAPAGQILRREAPRTGPKQADHESRGRRSINRNTLLPRQPTRNSDR